jgi:hypothetical protein
MAYIGKSLVGILNESKTIDTMTGNGSTTTLTLSKTPGSVNNVEVYMDGVFQTPSVEYTLSGNTVSFSTAPENGMVVVAVSGNDSEIITPNDNSISGTKIAGAVVTDAKIAGMAANKLNGALPAVDGSALTNMPSGVTKNASDPAIDTNPSGGVGTIWANTTSGEMFVLTDATTDENVWFNVGGGDGDIQPWSFQGNISGYTSGGHPLSDVIDKFSFTADGNATDVGNMTVGRRTPAGQSSSTHGYISGGTFTNVIDKYSFTVDGNATDIANLTVTISHPSGCSSQLHGYTMAGTNNTASVHSNVIDRFPFASDTDATDHGDLLSILYAGSGNSSAEHGYHTGGYVGGSPAYLNVIQKFTFASAANATDVADMTTTKEYQSGISAKTHGYISGGGNGPMLNVIEKFTFASDANATDVGDLTVARNQAGGSSSTTHGYTAAGGVNGATNNTIDKFSFASDGNATDVGDVTVSRRHTSGNQY